MKIETSKLNGIALDWAVAVCENRVFSALASTRHHYAPSSNWVQGGPIIEREQIDILTEKKASNDSWFASVARYQNGSHLVGWRIHQYGATPLIAAMRCYVASKMGETVDIPDDLV